MRFKVSLFTGISCILLIIYVIDQCVSSLLGKQGRSFRNFVLSLKMFNKLTGLNPGDTIRGQGHQLLRCPAARYVITMVYTASRRKSTMNRPSPIYW